MKFIFSAILFACLVALSASLNADSKGLLCSVCKFFWGEVKKELPVVADAGDAELKQVVNKVCTKFTNSIPLLGQLCKTFGNDALEEIYQFILTEDGKINPSSICAHTKQC